MIIQNIPRIVYLSPLNTTTIFIEGLFDEVLGNFLNAATVSATLLNAQGLADAVIDNIAMPYQSGTNGNYLGIAPSTFNAPLGSGYTMQITAVQAGVQGVWSIPAQVVLRTKN